MLDADMAAADFLQEPMHSKPKPTAARYIRETPQLMSHLL